MNERIRALYESVSKCQLCHKECGIHVGEEDQGSGI